MKNNILTSKTYCALPIKQDEKPTKTQYFTIIISFFLFNSQITGQNTPKKDLSYYYSKTIKFSHNNNDSLIYYARKIQLSNNTCERVNGILKEAKGYYQKTDFKKTRKLVSKAINQSKQELGLCHKKNLIDAYNRLFYIAKNEDKYEEALKHLLKRKEIVLSLTSKDQYYLKNIIDVKKSLATLKRKLGLFDQGLAILKNSYKEITAITLDNPTKEIRKNFILQKASILNATGDMYLCLNQKKTKTSHLDSALTFYKKAYKTASSLETPNTNTEALYRMRQINVIFEKKDYELTLFYLKRYDSLFRKKTHYLSTYYYLKAISFRHEKKYDSAIYYSKKYANLFNAKKTHNKYAIYIYDNLAQTYNIKNKKDSALKYSNLTLNKFKETEENKRNTSIKVHAVELEEFKQLNQKLLEKTETSNLYKTITICLLALIIIIVLIVQKKKPKTITNKKKRVIDNKIESRIIEGLIKFENSDVFLKTDFTINTLAEFLETNSTYLSTIINKHKKKTFKQYLAELRINYTIHKLKTDQKFIKYSIAAIANEVGYTNASAFTRIFKKQIGKTPSEFIKSVEK